MCRPDITAIIHFELTYRIPETVNRIRETPFAIMLAIDSEVIIGRFKEHFLSVNDAFTQARATGFCFRNVTRCSSCYDFSTEVVSQQDL